VPDDVVEVSVPGSFEIPFGARALATSGRVDAVICIGAVIRGETTHYDLVAGECARGIQDVQLATGVPVAFGVLTTEDEAQALARSEGPGGHNVGEEAALVAVEMAIHVRRFRSVRAC
jgi:6,7-dimethyl-8-ribityllumazine synthase